VSSSAAFGELAPPVPVANRLMITLAVMSSTLIQVLDTTIVNVALPHMQGELGATADQISWVLTSYLVSSAIFMPLTGHFTDVLGRKRFLLICISGFVAASALCGVSQSLAQIVFFRLLQGIFGAALVPLSQAIMADAYPPHERGKAMAIWGLGVMVGPVAGPTLGGWLTDVGSWRWTFYINLPVGLLSLFLASQFVPDSARRARRMDWFGFGFMAVGIAGLHREPWRYRRIDGRVTWERPEDNATVAGTHIYTWAADDYVFLLIGVDDQLNRAMFAALPGEQAPAETPRPSPTEPAASESSDAEASPSP